MIADEAVEALGAISELGSDDAENPFKKQGRVG